MSAEHFSDDAAGANPLRRHPPSREQIAAELADHLAEATRESAATSSSILSALAAQRRFGNVRWIAFQCWWISHREDFMFRVSVWCMLAFVTLCMGMLTYGSYATQQAMSAQLHQVASEIQSIAAQQQAALAAQNDPRWREISGRLFLGNLNSPAIGADVVVRRLPDLEIVRNLRTDEQGAFRTDPLPPGDYCVVAPLPSKHNPPLSSESDYPGSRAVQPFYAVQSRPLSLPGAHEPLLLDVELRTGVLEVAFDSPPESLGGIGAELPLVLDVALRPLEMWSLPWSPRHGAIDPWPPHGLRGFTAWPTFIHPIHIDMRRQGLPWQVDLAKVALGHRGVLSAGPYQVSARLTIPKHVFTNAAKIPALEALARQICPDMLSLSLDSSERYYAPRLAKTAEANADGEGKQNGQTKSGSQIIEIEPGKTVRLVLQPPSEKLAVLERAFHGDGSSPEQQQAIEFISTHLDQFSSTIPLEYQVVAEDKQK